MKYFLLAGMAVGSLALIRMPWPCFGDDDQRPAAVDATTRPATATITYHVMGMRRTKSGAI